MNSFVNKTICALALVACVAVGMAQGGGQGRGGQRGGQRGGSPEFRLLARADVQKDLAITDDQKSKIEELATKMRPQRGQGGNGGGGNGGGGNGGGAGQDPEARAKAMAERTAATKKALGEILSPAQMTRLEEINIQLEGFRAAGTPDVQKKLALTEDQIAKVKELQEKLRTANQGLMEKMRDQSITREEWQAAQEKNNKALDAEMGKILTDAQKAKLKEMGGKKFEADPAGI